MRKTKYLNPVLGAAALCSSGVALADTVTITLGAGAATTAVPLSPSVMAMIAALVALGGYVALKNRKARGFLLAMITFGVAGAAFWFQQPAEATLVPDLTNTQLSATFNGCSFGTTLTFQNQSANSVSITGIVDDGNPNGSSINVGSSTCQVNSSVGASATCTIVVSPGMC